jgi:flagella basal body P-ring formation protein FlgA
MLRKKTTSSLFLFLFLIASPALCLVIELRKEAQVTTDEILLGDIAEITPAGVEATLWANQRVSRAPAPGKNKVIQTSSLITYLRNVKGAKNINWLGTDNTVVRRQGIELNEEQLKQIIAEYLAQNLERLPDADLRFTSVRAPGKIIIPTGDLTYTVTPSNPEIIGSSSFSIIFKVNGKTVKNCSVRGKLEAMADVTTAAVSIQKGSIITANQLEIRRQDISKLDTPYVSIAGVTGMLAKRTIRAGKAIDSRNVEQPPLIQKGEPVKIVATRGGLQLSTNGVALMDGRLGEFIRVKNIRSKKLIYCKIDAPGIVSVEF